MPLKSQLAIFFFFSPDMFIKFVFHTCCKNTVNFNTYFTGATICWSWFNIDGVKNIMLNKKEEL